MPVADTIQSMIDKLTEAKADAERHDKGQHAAGTRVRKAMQELKGTAHEVRQQVTTDRNARS